MLFKNGQRKPLPGETIGTANSAQTAMISSAEWHRSAKIRKRVEVRVFGKHKLDVCVSLHKNLFEQLEDIKFEKLVHKYAIDIFVNQQKNQGGNHSAEFVIPLHQLNKLAQVEIQQINIDVQGFFPAYSEHFPSERVEYDRYLGQSLTPIKNKVPSFIREIWKQQFNSMACWGHTVLISQCFGIPNGGLALLISVQSAARDNSFREDERGLRGVIGYRRRYLMRKNKINKMRIKDSREGFIRPDSLAILFPVDAGGQKINAPLGNEVFLRKRKSDFENNTLEELLVGRARGATQADVVLDDIYKQCHLKLKDENIFANYQFNYF